MNLQTEMRKASPAGLRNHVEKMLKQGHPLANICMALGVNATFVAKVRKAAGLQKTIHGVATSGHFAHAGQDSLQKAQPVETSAPDSPYVKAAKDAVRKQTAVVAKALRKEDAATYVPRLVGQLVEMGESRKTIFACFTKDQHDLVVKALESMGKA
jgi:hypothetical protein